MRLVVPVAMLLMSAPACASERTSREGSGRIAPDDNGTTASDDTVAGTTPISVECNAVDGPPPPNVKLGDCGDFVVELQIRLSAAVGYLIPADGVFDDVTEQAVKDFQSDSGLTIDGIVGRKTWAALLEGSIGD